MILLTGGSGRLGKELKRLMPKVYAPPRREFDVLAPNWDALPREPSMVVHCAAYTDLLRAETDFEQRAVCFGTNITGTRNMTRYPVVYVSTEYVFDGTTGNYTEDRIPAPLNHYGSSKAQGEKASRWAERSLVIRCLFKERPYRHPVAPVDQWTSGDYVDKIAPMIVQAIQWFKAGHFKDHDTIHIGTERKSTYDLAKQTRDVDPGKLADMPMPLPRDTSLDCSRFWEMADEFAHGY